MHTHQEHRRSNSDVSGLSGNSDTATSQSPQFSLATGLETESAPFTTLTSAFYAQAKVLRSSEIAVWDLSSRGEGRKLTYEALAAQAQALTLYLLKMDIRKGHRIPLVAKRGLESVTAILAILSCGAQFVPVDYEYHSVDYLSSVVTWSGRGVILSTSSDADNFLSRAFSKANLISDIKIIRIHEEETWGFNLKHDLLFHPRAVATDVCYTVFKAGTCSRNYEMTKEVHVKHESVVNLVCLRPGSLGVCPGVKVGQMLSVASDFTVWEIFGCLCNGGTLVIGGDEPDSAFGKIDVLITTPTMLSRYDPKRLPKLRVLAVVGESISNYVADRWSAHVWTFWSCYGTSETTIVASMSRHRATSDVSPACCRLGSFPCACPTLTKRDGMAARLYPIPNSSVYILDDYGKQRAIGLPGSIWIGGRGVSDECMGYDRESYVLNPFLGNKSYIYRTGDYGFCNKDGSVELISPVPVQDYVTSGHSLSRVELQKLDSAWACADIENENEEDLRLAASMEDHVNILQQNGDIPTACYVEQYHRLEELPVGVDGKLDRDKLREEVRSQELQNPPRLFGTTSGISSLQILPKPVVAKEPVSHQQNGVHQTSIRDIFTNPFKAVRRFKGFGA